MIRRGDKITWLPQWRDKGDDNYTFVAVNDESFGKFDVSTVENTMFIRPQQIVWADMVESHAPYLPVVTLTFRGLERAGARVEMRRTLGDAVLSVTEEVIPRSQFRDAFRRFAKDCRPDMVLGVHVEWPEQPERRVAHG